ncbi:MAG TPA: DUF3343 domain-containing protein [Longimicrobiaceae bacterium]|nr:DUF3343 domain-containing protein [Longimicrobiaceae bacterium]
MTRTIFTFDTTHHALWAEEVARERRIAHEVIPAPPEAHAKCSIAIETLPDEEQTLAGALDAATVPYALYLPPG